MTQEPRPTADFVDNVLQGLRSGCDGFRDYGDYYQRVDEFRIDCLMEDAVKVIEHLQAKSLTPEQVERARSIVSQCDYYAATMTKLTAFESLMCELLREVVGDE